MPKVAGSNNAGIGFDIYADVDQASLDQAKKSLETIGRAAAEAEKRAEANRLLAAGREAAAFEAAAKAQGKSVEQYLIGVKRKEAADQAAAEKRAQFAKQAEVEARAQLDAQERYRAGLMKSREDAERLAQVSTRVGIAGAAILAPFIGAMTKFTQNADKSDVVAKRYRASMASLEQSTMRVGRATTDLLNPALEVAAKAVADIAGVIEKNPALLSGILAVGGGMVGLSVIGNAVVMLKDTVATMQLLAGVNSVASAAGGGAAVAGQVGASAAGAVGGGGLAALATAAAPVVIPALIAAGGIALIAAAYFEYQKQNPVDPSASAQVGNRLTDKGAFGSFGGEFAGITPGLHRRPELVTPGLHDTRRVQGPAELSASENAIQMIVIAKAREAAVQRAQVEEETQKKIVAAQESYAATRERIESRIAEMTRSFLQADAQAQQDYYNQRRDIARSAGIEAERAEEDHQRAIQKIQQDSDRRIRDLAYTRDALGIVTEKQNAEDQRRESENSYLIEVRRRHQDLAERLRIMDREFSITRSRRLQEYQYNVSIQRAELEAAQKTYAAIVDGAAKMVQAVQTILARGIGSPVARPVGTPPVAAYATGGTVDRTGPAIVHKDEIVISRDNRRMAENLIGGSLSQNGIMELIARAGNRANITNNFGNSVSVRQVAQMIDFSAQSLLQTLAKGAAA